MSEIKLNNGDEVIEALKNRKALGMAPRGTVQKLVVDHCGGEVDMKAVRRSEKANTKFIVNSWHDAEQK